MEKKEKNKLAVFLGVIGLVLFVVILAFIFWNPLPEVIQGEAEATVVRISGKEMCIRDRS